MIGAGIASSDLRARIVTQQQRGKLVLLYQRHGVTVLAILHRNAEPVGEKIAHLRRISRHSDCGDETFGDDERTSRFQLPGRKPIAHNRVEREIERFQSIEEFLIDRFEQREIRFVINNRDVGGSFLAGLGALQLDVILIRRPNRPSRERATAAELRRERVS